MSVLEYVVGQSTFISDKYHEIYKQIVKKMEAKLQRKSEFLLFYFVFYKLISNFAEWNSL